MKKLRTKFLIFTVFVFVLAGTALFSLGHDKVSAKSPEGTSTSEIRQSVNSSSSLIELIGEDFVYRDSVYTYAARITTGFGFITFDIIGSGATLGEVTSSGNYYYQQITINPNALLYGSFELRAIDVVTSAVVSKTITVVPVYATGIDEIVFNRNNNHETLDEDDPTVNPGDVVYVNIRSFIIDEIKYGLADNVTFTDFALVLDSSSTSYARLDSTQTSIIVNDRLPVDNPVILFTVVIIQPGAPVEYRNLTKENRIKVFIPVTEFEMSEKEEKQDGLVDRDQSFEYGIIYNSDNVASLKGYTTRLYDRDNNPVDSSSYFDVDTEDNGSPNFYGLKVAISKDAPYGSYLKVVITSIDNPALQYTFDYDVKLLESGYRLMYSKDYQGSVNDDKGVQLIEKDNKTQLRNRYNADILFEGSTTGRVYTPQNLMEYGVDVKIGFSSNEYFLIDLNGTMQLSYNAPAYTDGARTAFDYSVEISDGTKAYNKMQKKVEVFKPLEGSSYKEFYLSGNETVKNGGNILYTSYVLNFSTQGEFTAQKMDLVYTADNCQISKDSSNNVLNLRVVSPGSVGNSITITVSNEVMYNNQDIDGTWQHSIIVYRKFVSSPTQLNQIRNDIDGTYNIINDISYYKIGRRSRPLTEQ